METFLKPILDWLSKHVKPTSMAFSLLMMAGAAYFFTTPTTKYGWLLFGAGVVALAGTLGQAHAVIKKRLARAQKRRLRNEVRRLQDEEFSEKLGLLGEEDKNWLRPLFAAGERTTWKHQADAIGNRLARAGIAEVDRDVLRGQMTGFTITDAAWKVLLARPDLLEPRKP